MTKQRIVSGTYFKIVEVLESNGYTEFEGQLGFMMTMALWLTTFHLHDRSEAIAFLKYLVENIPEKVIEDKEDESTT